MLLSKGYLTTAAALLLVSLLAAPVRGQQPGTAGDSTVTLNFQEADLRLVVASLAELSGLAISYSGLPSKTVTLRSSTPVPRSQLRPMLESVLRANGLALVQEGGLARVVSTTPAVDASAGAQRPQERQVVTEGGVRLYIYRLRHSQADKIAETLRELFGLGNRTSGPAPAGDRAAAREARRLRLPNPLAAPESADAPAAPAAGVSGHGLTAELHGSVQIIPDPLTNTLLIRGEEEDYQVLRAAIQELDTRPLQVLIEVLIAEVRRDRQSDLGITISVPDQRNPESGITLGGQLKGGSAGDVALNLLGIGAVRGEVVLRALAASSNVDILSRPVVLAQNNQEARILVGTQRPFVQITRALPTDAAVRDQVIQYRDVGTQLTITPTINPDGYVTLQVQQEVSSATTETQFGAPVISTREVETQLFIKDGHTAVIGGLVDHQREAGDGGIPILKDIPLVGNLFRSTRRRRSATELFLLLTPHVIRTDQDLDHMSDELQESAKDLRGQIDGSAPLIERAEPAKRKRRS